MVEQVKKRAKLFYINVPKFMSEKDKTWYVNTKHDVIMPNLLRHIKMIFNNLIKYGDLIQIGIPQEWSIDDGLFIYGSKDCIEEDILTLEYPHASINFLNNSFARFSSNYGTLQKIIKIWEEPYYFTPRYWYDIKPMTIDNYKISGLLSTYIWADLSPYLKEIKKNITISNIIDLHADILNSPPEKFILYTSFYDSRKYLHNIILISKSIFLTNEDIDKLRPDLERNIQKIFYDIIKLGSPLNCFDNENEILFEDTKEIKSDWKDRDVFIQYFNVLSLEFKLHSEKFVQI